MLTLDKEEVFELLINQFVPILKETASLQPLGKNPDFLCAEATLALLSWLGGLRQKRERMMFLQTK